MIGSPGWAYVVFGVLDTTRSALETYTVSVASAVMVSVPDTAETVTVLVYGSGSWAVMVRVAVRTTSCPGSNESGQGLLLKSIAGSLSDTVRVPMVTGPVFSTR